MQLVERKIRSLCLELQGNEGSTPLGVYSPHIHQGRLQASQETTKEDESNPQTHSQGRTTKTVEYQFHLSNIRQSMGFTLSNCP